ncbi:hypothetical protein [Streptomyces sp. NRRL F-5630]|uniref:hypothetical protein n=1 Tax=Streptomyces sp. NRRL F-5630 TaxID=1463864 RepID=UPI003D710145
MSEKQRSPLDALITHEAACPACATRDLTCPVARKLYRAYKASWASPPTERPRPPRP